MIGPDQAIMSCHIGHAPIAPAGTRTQCLGIGSEFLRPRHQPVGFTEGMGGNGVAPQIGILVIGGEDGAATQQSAVAVASGAGEDDVVARSGEDRIKVTAICQIDGKRVELARWNNVVRDQPIFGDPAWPAGGIETDQPSEASRRRGERAGRHPGHGDGGLEPVILFQCFQRAVDRAGGPCQKGFAPDGQCPALEEGFADFLCRVRSLCQQIDRSTQHRGVIHAVGPVVWREARQQLVPGGRC